MPELKFRPTGDEGSKISSFVTCLTFVAAFFVLFVACGRQEEARPRVRIAVGGQPQLIYLPLTLADRLGYYRDEGLVVAIQDFPGGARALQSLMGGSADVVCGYFDHTIQMAAEGRTLTAFVAMLRYPGFVAIVPAKPRKPIHAPADLRGAVVGVTAPGSASHFFLNYLLARSRIPENAVSVTGIGTSASAVAAVERNQVDAAIVVEPTFTLLSRRTPDLRVLADTRSAEGVRAVFGVDEFPAAVLYAPESWLKEHDQVARGLARAIVRTLEWIRTHPKEIPDKVPEFVGTDHEAYAEALEHVLPTYSTDGRLTMEGARSAREVLSLSIDKVRTAQIDLSRTFTNRFIP
jgi:NitT/TauT family transport system substrate-binding protein